MNNKDVFESKDKQIVPFLMVQEGVKLLSIELKGPIVYFNFSPLDKCTDLINQFMTRKAPLVQPKDLLDAVETYRDRVFEMKDKRMNYEIPKNNQ
jgi:hypothetical protein